MAPYCIIKGLMYETSWIPTIHECRSAPQLSRNCTVTPQHSWRQQALFVQGKQQGCCCLAVCSLMWLPGMELKESFTLWKYNKWPNAYQCTYWLLCKYINTKLVRLAIPSSYPQLVHAQKPAYPSPTVLRSGRKFGLVTLGVNVWLLLHHSLH